MATNKPYPSLSTSGWLNSIAEKADRVLANFIATEENQTNTFRGQVTSLIYLIREHPEDMESLENDVRKSLLRLFEKYFEMVEVEVSTKLPDEFNTDKINISVDITVGQDGKKYNVGKEIRTLNSKVVEVFDLIKGK